MILYMDNKGGVDLFNNWSTSGNTQAVAIRFAFVRELKESGIIAIKWIKGDGNCADLFTKNVETAKYEKHESEFSMECCD